MTHGRLPSHSLRSPSFDLLPLVRELSCRRVIVGQFECAWSELLWIIGSVSGTREKSITTIEVQAVEAGLQIAKEMGYTKVTVGADSMCTVDCINGRCSPTWRARKHVNAIKKLMAGMEEVQVQHIYRETNSCADYLASLCLREDPLLTFVSPYTLQLENLITQDAMGAMYLRM
ncbi:Ribonuclease h domain [Thalictrum thalictroides]|uniref:Ribonuclease h domain n=1 Tax=Thalictrum thalictroides TaxID=46969 RepID=A0A7J6XFP8_THATH|nr:Ribonuclease h domain [Thalictrum thalictroides]